MRLTESAVCDLATDGAKSTVATSPRAKLRLVNDDRFLVCMVLPHFHVEQLVFYRTSEDDETQRAKDFCKDMYQLTCRMPNFRPDLLSETTRFPLVQGPALSLFLFYDAPPAELSRRAILHYGFRTK